MFVDREFSQRIERAEGLANAAFVETRRRLEPESGARRMEVAGALVMFDGVGSPCTQTFGLGLFDSVGGEEMDEIEGFFRSRGSDVFHEVSPLGDIGLLPMLCDRGYRAMEMSMVLFRELAGYRTNNSSHPDITARIIEPNEVDLWARTSAAGWATEHESLGEFMLGFGRISAQCDGGLPWIAELDGRPIAAAMMFIGDGVAMLAGATTIPEGRNRGAQNALLAARLEFAAANGCSLAAMATAPGSQSQKNSQRNGFQIAYTRTKWQLAFG